MDETNEYETNEIDYSKIFEFTNDQYRTMEMNLVTASKYLTKLKQESNNKEEDEYSYGRRKGKSQTNFQTNLNMEDILVSNLKSIDNVDDITLQDIHTEYIKICEKNISNHHRRYQLSRDITKLKDAIHRANAINNIDGILSELEYLQSVKSDFSKIFKKSSDTFITNANDIAKCVNIYKNNQAHEINIDIWNKEKIREQIKGLNRKIAQLESKRDELNIKTKISIQLSEIACDTIGI